MEGHHMDQLYTAVVLPLMLLVGQALVALGQRKISQRMDEGQAKTDAKRAAEAEWRDAVTTHMQHYAAGTCGHRI